MREEQSDWIGPVPAYRRRQEERPPKGGFQQRRRRGKGVKRDNRTGSSATEDVLLPRGSINATQGSVEETS